MDKQNEGIWDSVKFGDPGRHERFVTVDKDGNENGLQSFLEDVLFLVSGIIRNGLIEAASYPESITLIDICNLLVV